MANITEEHLHHMARRHHATMKQLDGLREKFTGIAQRGLSTIETAAGAWIGGAVEGKTSGGTILNIPYNLLAGAVLLAVGHANLAKEHSGHLLSLGNGFIGSFVAASGYAFGKRWKDTGKLLGGGGHPWVHPYENGWTHETAAPAVHGDLSEGQMAAIVQRMQAAAAAPAHG
jgi:hypothetical protein